MEAFADDAANSLMAGIDFNDMIEWTEEELKIMEERNQKEQQEIEDVSKAIGNELDKLHDGPGSERLRLLKSLLNDESLILDTILGNLQEQPQNRVNLKFILAKNKIFLEHFEYTMEECNEFTTLHPPRDESTYDRAELIHILKLFIVFLYSNKDFKPVTEEKPALDDGEEAIET